MIKDPDAAQFLCRDMPFYDSATLVRVRAPDWKRKNLSLHFIELDSEVFWLDGTSPPIHELNARAPLQINERNVLDYLRFFTFYVHGEQGPFYLAEDIADPTVHSLDETA